MAIERVKIRATVSVAGITVSTPFVQSFNVRKQRGQVSTFDATLKVSHDEIGANLTGGAVAITAGAEGNTNLIFTGVCRAAKISPCYDDPKYVILSVSGADAMSLLNGKKYTRRCRSTKSTWVAITGVARDGLKSGKFAYTNEPTITMDGGKLEKESNLTAHNGTAVTDRVKPSEAPSSQEQDVPQLTVSIFSSTDPLAGGGA